MSQEVVKYGEFDGPTDSMGMMDDTVVESAPIVKIEYMAGKDKPTEFKKGLLTIANREQVDKIRFVCLAAAFTGNIMYPEKFDPDKPDPLCVSDNNSKNAVPIGGIKPEEGPCKACGKSNFQLWMNTKGEKSPCTETTTMLGYDLDKKFPFVFTFKRRARTKIWGDFKALMRTKHAESYKGIAQTNWCWECELSVEDKDTYFQPVLKIIDKIPEKEAKEMGVIFEASKAFITGASIQEIDAGGMLGDEPEQKDNTATDDDLPF